MTNYIALTLMQALGLLATCALTAYASGSKIKLATVASNSTDSAHFALAKDESAENVAIKVTLC